MTHVDDRLRESIRSLALPAAPDSLRNRLRSEIATLPAAESRRGRTASRPRLLLAAATLVIVGTAAAALIAGKGPIAPPMVDGLRVMTVSEAMAAHAGGGLPGSRAAIRGWWSGGFIGHSCASPIEPTGELELYCHDGEYGITEREEQMFVVDINSGLVTYQAQGPSLTPFFPSDLDGSQALFSLPRINGQQYRPVPILVVGHFDDARATACREAARQLCRDRLVLERIVDFEPGSVPTPAITPEPTAFPDPPPAPLFDAAACAGDVRYAFVGWTTTASLDLPYERPGHVFAMVTADPILLTEDGWQDDPNGSGHRFQIWGPKICIAEEGPGHEGEMGFGSVRAGTYVLWDDGARVPGSDPIRPPGAS
jgi:hypothetical protein